MLSLLVESWTWYGFACLILICRYISRWLLLGSIKRLQAEDYIMVFAFGFYTTLLVTMNIIVHYPTNLLQPEDIPKFTPQTIAARIYGSKLVVVVEQTMIQTIWACKISLLYFYNRLTFGLVKESLVKIVAVYVVLSWIIMEVLYFLVWCRPFPEYWAVPTDNIQCNAATHHLITNFVFNVSSDLLIMCIPLPLLVGSRLPLAKRIMVCGLFSLGIFVILCAILNKYNSFHHYNNAMWTFWYIRETSTAVYVANIPMCWALLRRVLNLGSFFSTKAGNEGAIEAKAQNGSTGATSTVGEASMMSNERGAPLVLIDSGDRLTEQWDREFPLTTKKCTGGSSEIPVSMIDRDHISLREIEE